MLVVLKLVPAVQCTFAGMTFVSTRARDNLKPNKLMEFVSHAFASQYEPDANPNGIIALAVAENKLMHPEICEHITEHFKMIPRLLTYAIDSQARER